MFNKKKNTQTSSVDTSTKTAVSDNQSTSVIGNAAFGGGPGTVVSLGNIGSKGSVKITNYFPPEVQALFQSELESSERQIAGLSSKFGDAQQKQLDAFETLSKNTSEAILAAKQESRSLISAVLPIGIVFAVLGGLYLITKKG